MPNSAIQLLRAPPRVIPVEQRVVGCRFIGVVMLTHPDKSAERIELEIYLNPTNGAFFGVDAAHMAGIPPRIANFLNPEVAGVLDISDEPADRLLAPKTVRFMSAVET